MSEFNERLQAGLLGLLIGDALGVPYEFHPPEKIPEKKFIEYVPPANFRRAHVGILPGTWSDDGAHALCLLASLLECRKFEIEDFADRLQGWYDEGYMAVDAVVFDVGNTTGNAIRALKAGCSADQAGPRNEYDNGNGSLMRVLPVVLWHRGTDEELVAIAREQSLVTHGHLRSQICCALYCLWGRYTLSQDKNPWKKATEQLRDILSNDEQATQELEFSIRPDDPPSGKGSGYVVDCLRSARYAIHSSSSFESTLKFAISLGKDTDTTACVAGGIAGLKYGIEDIPNRWKENLRGKELLAPLLDEMILQCGKNPE